MKCKSCKKDRPLNGFNLCQDCAPNQNTIVKETRGGKREGSGRPKGNPTKTLAYRVPLKLAGKIDKAIRKIINELVR